MWKIITCFLISDCELSLNTYNQIVEYGVTIYAQTYQFSTQSIFTNNQLKASRTEKYKHYLKPPILLNHVSTRSKSTYIKSTASFNQF